MVCIESALETRTIKPIRDLAIRRSARSLKTSAAPTKPVVEVQRWERRSLNGAGWGGMGHNGPVYGTSVAATKHLSQTHLNEVTRVPYITVTTYTCLSYSYTCHQSQHAKSSNEKDNVERGLTQKDAKPEQVSTHRDPRRRRISEDKRR